MIPKPIGLKIDSESKFDEVEQTTAVNIINGIVQFVLTNGWKQGYRNDMAVNLCICCKILGVNPSTMFTSRIFILDGVNPSDRQDFERRARVISKYIDGWMHSPFDYVLDIGTWERRGTHLVHKTIEIIPE